MKLAHLGLAALTAACVAVLPAAPALAASSVTAKPATAYADAGTKDLVSGRVSTGVVRTALQYNSGGKWYTSARASISHGTYSMNATRTNNGYILYRVVGVNSAGSTAAVSPSFRIRWFTWQLIGTGASDGSRRFSVCSSGYCYNDQTLSFNGRSFPHSVELNNGGYGNPSVDKFEYDVHLANLGCNYVRWTDGFSSTKVDSRDSGTVSVNLDGNGVYSGGMSPSAAGQHAINAAGHDLVSFVVSSQLYYNGDNTDTYVVLGTPAVHCYHTIP